MHSSAKDRSGFQLPRSSPRSPAAGSRSSSSQSGEVWCQRLSGNTSAHTAPTAPSPPGGGRPPFSSTMQPSGENDPLVPLCTYYSTDKSSSYGTIPLCPSSHGQISNDHLCKCCSHHWHALHTKCISDIIPSTRCHTSIKPVICGSMASCLGISSRTG